MSEIDVNHFVAYLTYNNNRGALGYKSVGGSSGGPEINYSADGMAVFYCRSASTGFNATIGQKLEYYKELHAGLVEEFGHGFSFAFAPDSDCSNEKEMAHFCQAMKELDPGITTIICGGGTQFIPRRHKETLAEAWKAEPYRSSSLLSNKGVKAVQESVETPLPQGIDYLVSSGFRNPGNPMELVRELLGMEKSVSEEPEEDDEDIEVKRATAEKIQRIVNAAYEKAMNPDRENELKIKPRGF